MLINQLILLFTTVLINNKVSLYTLYVSRYKLNTIKALLKLERHLFDK